MQIKTYIISSIKHYIKTGCNMICYNRYLHDRYTHITSGILYVNILLDFLFCLFLKAGIDIFHGFINNF